MMRRPPPNGQVAIVGFAQSPIQRRSGVPLGLVTLDTCRRAVADAGLDLHDIDGFTTGSMLPAFGAHPEVDGVDIVTANWVVEHLGVRSRWCAGFQGNGQLPGGVMLAAQAVLSGTADYVLLHRALANPGGGYHDNPMAGAAHDDQWSAPQGLWGPPVQIAFPYLEYMERYGATRKHMASVVVALRQAVLGMPWSYWRDVPLSVDDYLNARMIADPISVLDCDIPVTGAAAFVLTSAERAVDLPHPPVYLAGFGQGSPARRGLRALWSLDDIIEGGRRVARDLWESSGLQHGDVDIAGLYDGFSPCMYFWAEALGFAEPGDGHLLLSGAAEDVCSSPSFFSSGGSLGNGRMHGIPQLLECYLQLSQRAGSRQLANASVGLACHSLPNAGGALLFTTQP